MRVKSADYSWPRCPLPLGAVVMACVVVGNFTFSPVQAEAGTLVVPAWSFARGNARIYANPAEFADAGPVVGSGRRQPWGWTVEYDIDIPVTAKYTLQICYASAETRPVEVFVDGDRLGLWCDRVTFAPASRHGSGVSERLAGASIHGPRYRGRPGCRSPGLLPSCRPAAAG